MSAAATATRQRKSSPQSRATYQDVLDAPPHRVAEIVDGVLHTNPRPAMPHARASSSLGVKIGGPSITTPAAPAAGGSSTSRSCT